MAEWQSMFGDSDDDEFEGQKGTMASNTAPGHLGATLPTTSQSPYAEIRDNVGVGGGRGVFASRKLQAGSLIFSEVSSMPFRDASDLDDPAEFVRTVEQVCKDKIAYECCSVLHPKSIDDVPLEDVERVKENWGGEQLLNLASTLHVARDDILRVALTLQHNGFASGLYHTLTMVNHSCSPNCIKFMPTAQSNWASEIWTVKEVEEGEEITVCYCEPLEMTPRSMREYLQTQHRFSCMCALCTDLEQQSSSLTLAVEGDGGEGGDDGSTDGSGSKIGAWLNELEKIQDSVATMEKELQYIAIDSATDILRTCKKMIRLGESQLGQCGSIRTESVSASGSTLLKRSITVTEMRVLKVLVQAAAQSLYSYGHARGVKKAVLHSSVVTYTGSSARLLGLQRLLLGADHSDLSTTHSDLAEGLRCLVSVAGKEGSEFTVDGAMALLQAAPYSLLPAEIWGGHSTAATGGAAAMMKAGQKASEAEARRIKALYNMRGKYPHAPAALRKSGDMFAGGD